MRKLLLTIFTFTLLGVSTLFGQVPGGISYQGVARDASGTALVNQNIRLRISIRKGSIGGSTVYQETHAVTTSALGLFNIVIGEGSPIVGNFNNIIWNNDAYFSQVEMDATGGTTFGLIGVQQLKSVPYALVAKDVENNDDADPDPNNEIQTLSFNNQVLALSNGGGSVTIADADSDSTNELQTLNLIGNLLQITRGNAVTLPSDADPDSTNELQTLTQSGAIVTLSDGGGTITVNDADANPNNELQTITRSGTDLTLSNSGGTVSIADNDNSTSNEIQNLSHTSSGTNRIISISNGGTGTTINVADNDNSTSNEIQNLSATSSGTNRTLAISGGGTSATISVADNDNSTSNEIQTLSVSGSTITISGGNSITAPSQPDNDWTVSGSNVYRNTTGTVGVGTSSVITSSLIDTRPTNKTYGIYMNHDRTSTGTTYGVYVDQDNTAASSSTNYAYYGDSYKTGSTSGGRVYGGYFSGRNYNTGGTTTTYAYGVYGYGFRSTTAPVAITYGVYGLQGGSAATEYGGYFNGNVYTTGTYTTSDRKLKHNIQPYTGAVARLMQLGTYTYEFNDIVNMQLPAGQQIGVMADEMEQAFPHLVKPTHQPAERIPVEDAISWVGEGNYELDPNDKDMAILGQAIEFKAVNYTGLVPVLVQGIKEQQKMIDQQNSDIQSLINRVQQLESELQQIKGGKKVMTH